jgi:hypothetical protein
MERTWECCGCLGALRSYSQIYSGLKEASKGFDNGRKNQNFGAPEKNIHTFIF